MIVVYNQTILVSNDWVGGSILCGIYIYLFIVLFLQVVESSFRNGDEMFRMCNQHQIMFGWYFDSFISLLKLLSLMEVSANRIYSVSMKKFISCCF